MKKMFWLITGLTAGIVIARKIEQNPAAKAVAEELIKSGKELAGAFMDGFEETHAEKPVASAKPKPTAAKTAARKPSVRKPAAK
ncbi:MAG: hypothetical protein RIS55_205 [Actinomycetota bacterium]|jgi:hypothetical protein